MNRKIDISSQIQTSHLFGSRACRRTLYVFNCAATCDLNGNIETQLRRDEGGMTIDDLTYKYDDGTYGRKRNRLYHVNDAVTASAYPDDIDDQGTFDPNAVNENNNYRYDELGRLISDAQDNIQSITWRHDDKISSILKANDAGEIEFTYDPS